VNAEVTRAVTNLSAAFLRPSTSREIKTDETRNRTNPPSAVATMFGPDSEPELERMLAASEMANEPTKTVGVNQRGSEAEACKPEAIIAISLPPRILLCG
jgi:hypothetical protein